MTVKELKQKLENIPDNMDVMVMQTVDEFGFSLCEVAEVREVTFVEDESDLGDEGALHAKTDCFVITDEL